MILQKMQFTSMDSETEQLYLKKNKSVSVQEDALYLKKDGVVDLISYFNCFSSEKWKKYTEVENVKIVLSFSGSMLVRVIGVQSRNGGTTKEIMYEQEFHSESKTTVQTESLVLDKGVLGVEITSLTDDTILYSGSYETDQILEQRDIHIGIGICTFKREEYVARNMQLIKEKILDNENALSQGHISICISDNAGTLQKQEIEQAEIRIVDNKNLGGVGGFTRTMLEHMRSNEKITHILLMDDDAVISAESMERNYILLTLLKAEYQEYVIGGALIRLDRPTIQYENGANWNQGDAIEAIHHDVDLSVLENVLKCEQEYSAEYVGWWYSCIPVTFIEKNQLPLPLFIHRDDIEYGLRAEGKFLFLNGICVWHEAFENKLPGFLEYYDIRNLAITNAIHRPTYGAKEFKKMLFKEVSSNIGKYRYQYVDLNLKGAVDFLRGFQWFYDLDTLKLHGELGKYNYDAISTSELSEQVGLSEEELVPCSAVEKDKPGLMVTLWKMGTMNGHFLPGKSGVQVARPYPNIYELFRCKEVVYIDSTGKGIHVKRSRTQLIASYIKLWKVCRLIDQHYERVVKEYQENYKKLETKEFWGKYLEIN